MEQNNYEFWAVLCGATKWDSTILVSPFQLWTLCDSVVLMNKIYLRTLRCSFEYFGVRCFAFVSLVTADLERLPEYFCLAKADISKAVILSLQQSSMKPGERKVEETYSNHTVLSKETEAADPQITDQFIISLMSYERKFSCWLHDSILFLPQTV